VRGQGHDVVRPGRLEANTNGGESVDPRRVRVAAPVTAERIRTERVDGEGAVGDRPLARKALEQLP